MHDRLPGTASGRPDFRQCVRSHLPDLIEWGDRELRILEELAGELEDIYDALLESGASPDDAWRQTERELRGAGPMGVRFAPPSRSFRSQVQRSLGSTGMRRDEWLFGMAAVATIGIAVALHATVFTIVNSVLYSPLPFPEPERVMFLADQSPGAGGYAIRTTVPSYFDRLERLTAFEDLAMFRWIDLALDAGSGPLRARGTIGTPSLLRLIGVEPILGRIFDESDSVPGQDQKIILAQGLWIELFGGDAAAVGRTLRVDGRPYEIVGVMPAGFRIFRPDARFWVPAVYTDAQRADSRRNASDQYQIGRLRAGATQEDARAELDRLSAADLDRFPQFRESRERYGFYVSVEPILDVITHDIRPTLRLIWGASALVLLVALGNLTSLGMARSERLRGEMTTRMALGAGTIDLVRPLLVAGVGLGAAGGAVGLIVASVLLRALDSVGLDTLPHAEAIQIDVTVVLVTLGLAFLAGILVAAAPAFGAYRSGALRDSGRTSAGTSRSGASRRLLVVAQVGAAFALLVGGSLMAASVHNLLDSDPGFDAAGVVSLSFDLPAGRYRDEERVRFTEALLDRIRADSAVLDAGATQLLPFGGRESASTAWPEHAERFSVSDHGPTWQYVVTTGYLETMRIPLLEGRNFSAPDMEPTGEVGDPVVIVDRALAERFWPGTDPVGERLFFGIGPELPLTPMYTVIGVVEAIRQEDLAGGRNSRGATYIPHSRVAAGAYSLVARTTRGPESLARSIREILSDMDPDLAVYDVETMDRRTLGSLTPRRLAMRLVLLFAFAAVSMATVGVYGLLAYLVSMRRREFGIRMALGGTARSLAGLVAGEGAALIGTGIGLGLILVYLFRSALASYLYRVGAADPVVVGTVGVAIAVVGGLACLGPAVQATRVDPMTVLGDE